MTTAIVPTTPTTTIRPYTPLLFDPTILAEQLTPSSIAMYAHDFRAYLTTAQLRLFLTLASHRTEVLYCRQSSDNWCYQNSLPYKRSAT